MNPDENPFQYEAASNLTPEQILSFYIEDYNFSRFINSTRNIFLVGERGCGKTMALLYNSFEVQALSPSKSEQVSSLERIGIYVPCNTPLTHKQEYILLDPFRASVISEHYLVLSILFAIANCLATIAELLTAQEDEEIRKQYSYILDAALPAGGNGFFSDLKLFTHHELASTQRAINDPKSDSFYLKAISFSSAIMPLFDCIKAVKRLSRTHFMLMLDDAQNLNKYQIRALNSWISYRDHSQFSFKVATTKVDQPDLITATDGCILEGHDFTQIDMEHPYQFESSSFGRFARLVIERRLSRINVSQSAEQYFPVSPDFEQDLAVCKVRVEGRARSLWPKGPEKKINDYVYKYTRAEYFRSRSHRANRPPYSGFELLTYLSTGVIRNLLEPCFWMFDKVRSAQEKAAEISYIPHTIQREIILERSQKMWDRLEHKLPSIVVGCSAVQAKQVFQLLDQLGVLFRERLLRHESEPRALSFTISGMNEEMRQSIVPLLNISRKAQALYVRTGAAKDDGKREPYYVPNRMLWPARGLDPQGQHARVSLKAKDILAAAMYNTRFPFDSESFEVAGDLFNE
jgi:hypothetical protein